jgi:hypothetical protein
VSPAIWLLGLASLAAVGIGLRGQLRYRITRRHVRITVLGVCVRRIRLEDIESISKRAGSWAEHWENTWRPKHRRLVIHRRRGWIRDIIVTPSFRYEFWTALEQAVARLEKKSESG